MAAKDDSENLEQIREYFKRFETTKKEGKNGFLHLTIEADNGNSWKTTFTLSDYTLEDPNNGTRKKGTKITNGCIHLFTYTDTSVGSMISANTKEPSCFTPRLVSEKGITTTDVLQILKTKLTLIHPLLENKQISISDAALIKNKETGKDFPITPYRIVRGQLGLYEKYGYKNEKILKMRELLKDLKIEDINNDVKGDIEELSGLSKGPVIEAMKLINNKDDIEKDNISLKLYYYIEDEINKKFPEDLYIDITDYNLDEESEEWKLWSQKIVISNVEYEYDEKNSVKGEKRKITRRKKRKVSKLKSKRRQRKITRRKKRKVSKIKSKRRY